MPAYPTTQGWASQDAKDLVIISRHNTSFPTATAAVKVLEDLGIVTEMTGQKKNRSYSYQVYVELLSR